MFKSFRQNANDLELTDVKEYILFKDDKEIDIRTGKTKTKKYLVIQAQYECNKSIDSFQTKLTLNNLKEKSTQFSSVSNIDQSFVLFTNLFDSSEVWVKDIINKNYLKLVFKFQKKDLEINLPYKKNEKNIFYHKSQTYNQSLNNINIDENLNINEIQKNDINEIKEEELNKEEEKNKEEEENKERQSEDEIPNNNINNQEEQNKNKDEGNNIIIENNGEEKNNINNININNINENKEQIDTGDNKIENENIENKKEILNYNSNIKEEQDKQDKTNINDEIQNDNNIINEENIENNNKENYNNNENDNKQKEVNIQKEENDNENNINNKNNLIGDININELFEKIKKLEDENKNLKKENNELKEKLSLLSLNEEKLKKSEKEKENLKIELQKLKNSLNKNNTIENKQNKKSLNAVDSTLRQHSLDSIINIYQTNTNKNKKEEIKKKVNKNINKNEIIENENQNKINFESKSPINLKVHKTITQSSYIPYTLDNSFTAFLSLNNELLLVYPTKNKSIECFDLIKNKFHKTILNAHNGLILTIRHYCPKNINKDIILTGANDFCVKVWDVETWSCICNINKIYPKGNMYSVCVLFDEFQKESFIFTSSDSDYIKIWDFHGKFIKNINKTNNNENYFIDTYYDNKEYKYYLISGEMKCVKSYELNTHQLYRTYSDGNSYSEHVSAFIYKQGGIVKLVESEFYGSIRIWNFHNGYLIKKIDICRRIPLVSMCLWNENYLLVSSTDNTIKLVDFKNYALIKSFSGHNNEVGTIKKIIHPTFGECLLSQGLANEQIKLWVNG